MRRIGGLILFVTFAAALLGPFRFWTRDVAKEILPSGGSGAVEAPVKEIPATRAELTAYIRANLARLREAKKRGTDHVWVKALGQAIVGVGVDVSALDLDAEFAALFAVNQQFHGGARHGAREEKNKIACHIWLRHRTEVQVSRIAKGGYASTYEVRKGPWSTHLPFRVADGVCPGLVQSVGAH